MFSGSTEVKHYFRKGQRKQNERKIENKIMLPLKVKTAIKFYPGKINSNKAARPTLIQNSSAPPY